MKNIIKMNILLLFVSGAIFAQSSIEGTVTDAKGSPLAGANVVVDGTSIGGAADRNGNYQIDVSSLAGTSVSITASYIGYKNETITAEAPSSGSLGVNFSMNIDAIGLEQVVAVGYGTARKEELTGAVEVLGAEMFEQIPNASFQDVLQGSPGLQVVSNDGSPGAAISIRVRGIGSMNASNEPLYVIDGIPVQSGSVSTTDFSNGGRSSNVLSSINPNDIESIVVAKDAASTAIYGSRGANGVVMINTKQGRANVSKVDLKVQRGFADFAYSGLNEGLNTSQYKQLYTEGYVNSGKLSSTEAEALYVTQFPNPANTNWLNEMTHIGVTNSVDISASGGNEDFRYFLSGSIFDQAGTVKNNFFDRYSSRANLTAQLTDKLSLTNNLNLSYFNQRGITDGTRWQAPFYLAYLMSPAVPIKDDEGQYYSDHKSFYMGGNNPVGHLYDDKRELEQTRIIDNFTANYQFRDDLSFKSAWSFDILNVDEYIYQNMRYGDGRRAPGTSNEGRTDVINWQGTQSLNYSKTFSELHNVDVFAAYEQQNVSTDVVEAYGDGFSHPELKTLASAANPKTAYASRSNYAFASYLSRVNYDYSDTYFASISFRTDGSSRFGPDKRWGKFWSGGVGVILSEIISIPFVDYLKFRGSYGETGNAGIGNYPWAGLYGFNREYDGNPGASPSQISNPILTWESQSNSNIGLDYAILNNVVSGTIEYFQRTSSDLLLDRPLSGTTGFSSVNQNIGDMVNSGLELSVNVDIVQSDAFDLSLNGNVTTLNNEITKLPEPFVDSHFRREEGRDFQEYYVYGWAGVNPANGDPLWYTDETESATTSKISEATRYYHGKSASPGSYGSFGAFARYGRLTVSANANYSFGGYLYDNPGWVIHGDGRFTPRSTSLYAFENRWTTPGQESKFPQHRWGGNQSSNQRSSSRYMHSGDFIRLKNINLAYNVPTNLVGGLGVSNLEVYVNVQNYFTWVKDKDMKFDPEQAINGIYNTVTPITKTISIGFNIGL
jgi:TonB-linked SusC/RagA family outer membrane protein